jgi:hypothetical protein
MRFLAAVGLTLFVVGCGQNSSVTDPTDPTPNNVSANNVVTANNVAANNVAANNVAPNNSTFIRNNDPMTLPPECNADDAAFLYQRRIEPLVTGGQPATCNQCHLQSVDLAMFVQDTPCQSMACLKQLDLVDFESPASSRILAQIMLAEPGELITDAVIQAEHDGFLAWIEYSALALDGGGTCHDALCGDIPNACSSGTGNYEVPDGVLTPLGKCDEQRVGEEFQRLVYSSRERCAGCHNPDGPRFEDDKNPVYFIDMNYEQGGEFGAAVRTMYNMIGRGHVNPTNPELSMLLLKPLAEAQGGVMHEGGDKFAGLDDATYLAFLEWINLFADCSDNGTYPMLPQEPYVSILNADRTIASGELVNMNGIAIDPQDGIIEVRWESSIGGLLGSGQNLMDVSLAVGTHTITLRARDSDANEVTDTGQIIVQ